LTGVSGELAGKRFAFEMEFDPGFEADARLLDFLQKGKLYEPEVTAVFGRVLRQGDTVVDVGSQRPRPAAAAWV
jgi:hypothetical protein